MKILLTGSRGFIGGYVHQALIKHQHTVTEYTDYGHCPDVKGQDLVIHLGAISATTERNVEKVLSYNVDFSQELFERCQSAGIPMQYASSASVYGDKTEPISETAPVDPRSAYAWSKFLFDRWVSKQVKHAPVQGFRYFNVYGNGEGIKGPMASPYYKFHNMAETTGVIELFEGSNIYSRDFVCIEDIVDVHLRFIDQAVTESGIWNVGSGRSTTFGSIAQAVANKYSNTTIKEIAMPAEISRQYQKFTQAVNSKLASTVGKTNWIDICQYTSTTKFHG
jgi:ADP-L-glycero-D-manno-heptose 6-epimerase